MIKYIPAAILFVMCCIMPDDAHATHIIGGEILARRVDNVSLTYEITVIGYLDNSSGVIMGGGVLDFGDGQEISGPFEGVRESVTNDISRITFKVTHTFKGPSAAGYIISYREAYRNDWMINVNDGNAVQTDFYIETKLVIDPFLGSNDTPILTNPPTLWGQGGKIYQTDPGAYDPDGDLLTYRLVKVKRMKNEEVRNYKFPNDPAFYSDHDKGNAEGNGLATFSIDRFTGKLAWDAPGDFSLEPECDRGSTYNIAYAVEEWRNVMGVWKQMGYVIRDHIIEVDLCNENLSPMLRSFQDTCLYAGEQFLKNVIASNPDDDPLGYRADGEPLEIQNGAAYTSSETSLEFNWTPTCADVREEPYKVYFRATDRRSISLASVSSQSITVLGPEVTGVNITDESPGNVILSWDPYTCPNADSMEIWRKEGTFSGEKCDLIHPEEIDFQLIDKVPINQLSFTDNSIPSGSNSNDFTYHLKATFPGKANDPNELYDILTGFDQTDEKYQIRIFPNPTTGSITIDPISPGWEYKLYDLSGRVLQHERIDPSGMIDQFHVLHDGVYLITIQDQNDQVIYKSRMVMRK